MAQATESHKLTHKVKDTTFSIDDIIHYSLSILVGKHDFQFCVFDKRDSRCLLLEGYVFNDPLTGTRLGDSLYKLFESHELLMAGYWKSIKLIVKNQKFTLVPAPLFAVDNLSSYLDAGAETEPGTDSLHHYKHIQSDAVLVFAAEKNFTERIKSFYPTKSLQILHQASCLIEGVQSHKDFTQNKDLYLHIGQAYLSIIVTDNNGLLYFNRFFYKMPQDVVRYTMMVMQELGLDQRTTKTLVWGNIPVNAAQFKELYQYIRHVSYGGKPSYLQFSYAFDDLPDHQYFDLYSTYVCE